jgi:hypothetical protein
VRHAAEPAVARVFGLGNESGVECSAEVNDFKIGGRDAPQGKQCAQRILLRAQMADHAEAESSGHRTLAQDGG